MRAANDNPGAFDEWVILATLMAAKVTQEYPRWRSVPAIVRDDPADSGAILYQPIGMCVGWEKKFTSRTTP